MEKLKSKHDHKLTDILKVAIFGIFLLLPFMVFAPSCMYYGVNKYATPTEETINTYEEKIINYNQLINDNFNEYNNNGITFEPVNSYQVVINGTSTSQIGSGSVGVNFTNSYYNFVRDGRKYLVRFNDLPNGFYLGVSGYAITNNKSFIFSQVNSTSWNGYIRFQCEPNVTFNNFTVNLNIYDLTTMYGIGNEPTISSFEEQFPNFSEYVENEKQTLIINTGTTTYKNVVNDINYNWQKIWQLPMFNWTNNTLIKTGLDNFAKVFGITNVSALTNVIAYELIMVAIYIVIDIVLTLFKWLTHLIGEK